MEDWLFYYPLFEHSKLIELIIIPDQKNLWNTYYFKLIQGEFNELIESLRTNASTFYDYGL